MKTNINFMRSKNLFFVISLLVIALGLASIFFLKGFNQGIDFTGGLTAHLTINFEKSDIKMLRKLFSDVKLTQVDEKGTGKTVTFNLGRNISRLEEKDGKQKAYASQTYLIRVKNLPGVKKEQVEKALSSRISKTFTKKSKVVFAVSATKADDTGAALKQMLAPLKITDIKKSVLTMQDGNKKKNVALFVVSQEFTGQVVEQQLRNKINRLFINNPNYSMTQSVEFLSSVSWGSFNAVSATIGKEVEQSAVTLSIVVVLIILLYIAIRFDYKFGIAAIMALMHDVIIMLGIISLTGRELNVPIIAAMLTIFGYSINDTIVVFDRIRENLSSSSKEDLSGIINRSVNQSLSRTVITSLTTLLAVLSIYLFAGATLKDFAFSLLIGVVVGTYSSIYIASPLYLMIEKLSGAKELKKKKK